MGEETVSSARGRRSTVVCDYGRNGIESFDREFIIWLAGFFDGEGTLCIMFYSKNHPKSVRLQIGQTGERGKLVCEEIARKLGGTVTEYQPRNPRWKKVYVWTVKERDRVIEIAEMLLPYLKVKRAEVEEKLKILKEWNENGRKWWSEREIELLKLLGFLPATKLTEIFVNHPYNSIKGTKKNLGLKFDRRFSSSPIVKRKRPIPPDLWRELVTTAKKYLAGECTLDDVKRIVNRIVSPSSI
ncbi:MAG: hypothetical protein LM580_03180 [Thermofilum sp.]|nr:hypothetical protein [Thermofilum sp.]